MFTKKVFYLCISICNVNCWEIVGLRGCSQIGRVVLYLYCWIQNKINICWGGGIQDTCVLSPIVLIVVFHLVFQFWDSLSFHFKVIECLCLLFYKIMGTRFLYIGGCKWPINNVDLWRVIAFRLSHTHNNSYSSCTFMDVDLYCYTSNSLMKAY